MCVAMIATHTLKSRRTGCPTRSPLTASRHPPAIGNRNFARKFLGKLTGKLGPKLTQELLEELT